jgi:hypothetical protein
VNSSADIPTLTPALIGSERVRLARLARDAALRVPGVVATDAGPSGVLITEGAQERLEGVLCVATKDGGYDVTLRLVCGLVPLLALGEAVQAAVRRSADLVGVSVENVDVQVAAVVEPGEM